jgi:hypothetical protein
LKKRFTVQGSGARNRLLDSSSQRPFEFIDAQACTFDNPAHGICVDRIRPWDGDNSFTVGHRDMFSLPYNPKSYSFQKPSPPAGDLFQTA